MGHVNAGLEFLIAVFNDMWPLVLATFVGAWIAFQHHKHQEKRKDIEARSRAVKHTIFVIASQTDRLKQIYEECFAGKKNQAKSFLEVDTVTIHDEFPGLEMQALPNAFDTDNYKLMNQTTAAEQRFLEIVDMLKSRANRMVALEVLDPASTNGRKRRQTLESSLKNLTEKLSKSLAKAIDENNSLMQQLDNFVEERHTPTVGAITDYSSWYFLAVSSAIAGVFFFSHWAINARSLVNAGLDITLVSAVVFAVSLYASLAIGIIVAILSLFSLVKKLKSFSIYFWTFLISLQPMVFLLWLDVS